MKPIRLIKNEDSFNKGLYVKDWTEAHKLMKENNVDRYLITLKEVK